MAGDAESARAAAWQQRVLARVGEAIDKQVQAADEALRDAEDELVQTLGAQPQSDAYARWQQARTQRDAALAALDREAMAGCRAHTQDPGGDEGMPKEPVDLGQQHDTTDALVRAAKSLDAQHQAMQELEAQLAASQDAQEAASRADRLCRLRRQRVPRSCTLKLHRTSGRAIRCKSPNCARVWTRQVSRI